MTSAAENSPDLDWLITSFAERIPGVESVVVLSTDGLVTAVRRARQGHGRHRRRHLRPRQPHGGGGPAHGGRQRQPGHRRDGRLPLRHHHQRGSALAVMCGPDCDIGLIGYEMSMLVARIGQVLTPALRAELSMRPGP